MLEIDYTLKVKIQLKSGEIIDGVKHTFSDGKSELRDMCSNRVEGEIHVD